MNAFTSIWHLLTLGPVSIFSAFALMGMIALGILSSRKVSFVWGVYLAAFIALMWAPVFWHSRDVKGETEIWAFVVFVSMIWFLGMLAFWTLFRFMNRRDR